MSNKNEKTQIARDALSKMNLRTYDNDPKKEKFVNDRDLASQLGISKTTVWNVRQALINRGDEDYDLMYAWRWSGDDTCAKIDVSTLSGLEPRMASTYQPTDDPVLIGVMKCFTREDTEGNESYILKEKLERTRPDRE